MTSIKQLLSKRILLLDGAMGTEIQRRGVNDFNDRLLLERPELIASIHADYLAAGADIIETCTFNSQRMSLEPYGLADRAFELNIEGARLARREADRAMAADPTRPRFVAGSVGPTGKMLTMADDLPPRMFDTYVEAYTEQIEALIRGGVDIILLETVFDTLNAKAALAAIPVAMQRAGRSVEVMLSASVTDSAGRILSGQTIEALADSVRHFPLLSIGLNCSMGAEGMMAPLRRLSAYMPGTYISCHPNAGLPDQMGCYTETPERMEPQIAAMAAEGLVNIVGGCCGTTPAHIEAMRRAIDGAAPRPVTAPDADHTLHLSGLEGFHSTPGVFINIGERCNVAGSRKFLRLISTGAHDEALEIARRQALDGAMALDVNMDDAMLDAPAEMCRFLRMLTADPVAGRLPVMVDSSRFEVIEQALKCIPGRGIVNSLSLKEGEQLFIDRARRVRQLGAALIVMAFDEQGQATTYERKIEICSRAYRLLIDRCGYTPADIIFDPNILTVATGIADHADYALDFVRAAEWIHANLPGARVSGGISNLSFAFRGNNFVREAMHAVFLYHASNRGLDMAIMNPGATVAYPDVPEPLRLAIEDVLFGTRDAAATERLLELASTYAGAAPKDAHDSAAHTKTEMSLPERLTDAVVRGAAATLIEQLPRALDEIGTPLQIISGPLMKGMDTVGTLFAQGKMFLPQVVKTARAMKEAVDFLTPYMDNASEHEVASLSRGRILLATVKGDVHDIGKNIVGVILRCNNFEVIDLGVMVPPEKIVETARAENVDFVCLSGLITPSLDEMCATLTAMHRAGLSIPVMIGGATTSALHTAVKMAPLYPHAPVIHVKDASQNPLIAARYLDPATRPALLAQVAQEQESLRASHSSSDTTAAQPLAPIEFTPEDIFNPPFRGTRIHTPIDVATLRPLIDWTYFHHAWRTGADTAEGKRLRADAEAMLDEMERHADYEVRALTSFHTAARGTDAIVMEGVEIPTRRSSKGLAMCDFIAPDGTDTAGIFAVTMSQAFTHRLEQLKQADAGGYDTLLMQTLADRLAEAASTFLHAELGNRGIRPAVGYPSLPDQSAIFALDRITALGQIGITLTENGAMYPQASVAGLYIFHPQAHYFNARS